MLDGAMADKKREHGLDKAMILYFLGNQLKSIFHIHYKTNSEIRLLKQLGNPGKRLKIITDYQG